MSDPIGEIRGLGAGLKAKLEAQGIRNIEQLIEYARTEHQRIELAHKVGSTQHEIKELVNRADLMRVNGVGTVFSNLLEEAGVNSCKELQHRVPEHLHKTLEDYHTNKKLSQRAPTLSEVTEWVAEAKKLAATSPE